MSICNLDHFAESYWQTRRFGLVGGAFDPLHEGHLAYFEVARSFAPWLVCAVTPDAELRAKRTPCLPEVTRLKVLNTCTHLAHVALATQGIAAIVRTLQPSHYIVGKDWEGKLPEDTMDACLESGTAIVFVDCREQSSTALLADYERRRNAEKLAQFEAFVSQQQPASTPWKPVTDYSFEARKAIEGPHAKIIKDTFCPNHVVDVGCGPGHLMALLHEAGVPRLVGIDIHYTNFEKSMFAASITDASMLGAFRGDLVICREVLEHLTVQQIAIAVRNLMKMSSKYVYVTTRFTAKSHLLDVDGSDDLDPTHISLLHIDFLRSLFVLEGCTRRPDLEAKLDWMKKGRCLVYEVPA